MIDADAVFFTRIWWKAIFATSINGNLTYS